MSDQKIHNVVLRDAITASDHSSVAKSTDERIVGFSESGRQNLKAAVDLVNGEIQSRLSGEAPQGEADTLIAAKILVGALNAQGASWGNQRPASEPADCEADDLRVSGRTLRIQVVRASSSGVLWHQLGSNGSAEMKSATTSLVAELEAAIIKKADRYSRTDQAGLVLALDANRLPAFILTDVKEEAIRRLASVCSKTAFTAVWVVGPTSETTYSLFVRDA